MSTPISVEPAPIARRRTASEQKIDLQNQVQHMLDLQYQEQTLSQTEYNNSNNNNTEDGMEQQSGGDGHVDLTTQGTLGWGKRTATETAGLNTLVLGGSESEPPILQVTAPHSSAVNGNDDFLPSREILPIPNSTSSPPVQHQQGVGRGTLYFSNNYQNNYGGGGGGGSNSLDANRLNHPPQQQQQQQGYATYGAVPDQQHEFHYGNPDYRHDDPYGLDHDHPNNNGPYDHSEKSCCAKCCRCLFDPLLNLLSMEQLQRSFCYGAIDGMLTGSGIVSAFHGLGVLNTDAVWEVRLAVVAFSAAACVADSLCMAIGHIWTCYVVSSHHAEERSRERDLLNLNKADAKGKLVDMLLARGMLKIDAMSLADTLEGYPDLFVSTLVGDSLLGGGGEGPEDDEDDNHSQMYGGGGGNNNNIANARKASGGGNNRSGVFGSWRFPSYGQFNELDQDPEAGNVNMVLQESQREGFFMMLGFASFAVVPSLLWLYFPLMDHPNHNSSGGGGGDDYDDDQVDTISLPSLVITVLAIIMWTLGVWKSHFLDSNWVIFGVETVVVLLICVMSAYGVGIALSTTLAEGMAASNLAAVRSIIQH